MELGRGAEQTPPFFYAIYLDRYVLSTVIPVGILVGLIMYWLDRRLPALTVILVCILLVNFVILANRANNHIGAEARERAATKHFLRAEIADGSTLVISGPHEFFDYRTISPGKGGRASTI